VVIWATIHACPSVHVSLSKQNTFVGKMAKFGTFCKSTS
jgi:hypothetical protein